MSIASLSSLSRAVPWAGVNPARPAKAQVRMAPPERLQPVRHPQIVGSLSSQIFLVFFCDTILRHFRR